MFCQEAEEERFVLNMGAVQLQIGALLGQKGTQCHILGKLGFQVIFISIGRFQPNTALTLIDSGNKVVELTDVANFQIRTSCLLVVCNDPVMLPERGRNHE